MDWLAVKKVLPAKCAHRSVAIETIADVFEDKLLERVRGEWKATLGPFVRELPGVDRVLTETRAALERMLVLGSGA